MIPPFTAGLTIGFLCGAAVAMLYAWLLIRRK